MRLLPKRPAASPGGSVKLAGREISALNPEAMRKDPRRRDRHDLPGPAVSLNPTHTLGQQIAEAVLLARGRHQGEARERAIEVLDLVGMAKARGSGGRVPAQFSGGMRQRA